MLRWSFNALEKHDLRQVLKLYCLLNPHLMWAHPGQAHGALWAAEERHTTDVSANEWADENSLMQFVTDSFHPPYSSSSLSVHSDLLSSSQSLTRPSWCQNTLQLWRQLWASRQAHNHPNQPTRQHTKSKYRKLHKNEDLHVDRDCPSVSVGFYLPHAPTI